MGGEWSQCLGPTGLEKALGAVEGGAYTQGTEGAQACPPPLVSEGGAPHLGAQKACCAQVGRANALLSSPTPLVPEGPSRLPFLISRPLPYAPKDPHGLEGTVRDRGLAWELAGSPCPSEQGKCSPPPLPLLLEGPSCLPLLIYWASCLGSTSPPPSVPPHPTS